MASQKFAASYSKTFFCILALLVALPSLAVVHPVNRCYFIFSPKTQEMRRNIRKVERVLDWNFFMTGRGWSDYQRELSDEENDSYNLHSYILRKGPGLRWWDSGTGQGTAVKEVAAEFKRRQWPFSFVVNALKRPFSSRWGWPRDILYLEKTPSEVMPEEFLEGFDLITDVYGPGGIYSTNPTAVLNSYLRSLAVGGRLVLMTSFRTTIETKGKPGKVVNLAHWLSSKLRDLPEYRVHVTKYNTIWVEKLRSSQFQLPELRLASYHSDEELYRSFLDVSE